MNAPTRRAVLSAALLLGLLTACKPAETGCKVEGCGTDQTCNEATGQCEALPRCASASDCRAGEACLEGVCSSCQTNVQCTADLTTCDPATVSCVTCASASDCSGELSKCGSAGCTSCERDTDCAFPTPFCSGRWCMQCQDSTHCPAEQTCIGGRCAPRCSVSAGCPADAPLCESGSCVQCTSSWDCPEGRACYGGTCRATLPGDSCRYAIPLTLGGGSVRVKGAADRAWVADSAQNPLSSMPWVDVFYKVTVSAESVLEAELESLEGVFPEARLEVLAGDCRRTRVLGAGARAVRSVLVTPGTYFVRVLIETFATDGYTLRVSASPASVATGTLCEKPQDLTVGARGGSTQTLQSDLSGMPVVTPEGCTVKPRPARVYALTLQERSHLLAVARPLAPDAHYSLDLLPDCFSEPSTCPGTAPAGQEARLERGPLEPGRYLLLVRANATPGPVELTVTTIPWATNGTCAAATPVTLTDGAFSISGDSRYTDRGPAGCYGQELPQLLYRFSTQGLGARSLRIESTVPEGFAPPDVAVVKDCAVGAADGNILGCNTVLPAVTEVTYLPEGEYTLRVGGPWNSGPFTLRATLGPPYPPPANDACEGAEVLTADPSGNFSASGDTRGAKNDLVQLCTGSRDEGTSRDVVYALSVPERRWVEAQVTPTTPGFIPRVQMGRFTCTSRDACTDGPDADGVARVTHRYKVTSGTDPVRIWVDGADSTSGTFSLSGRIISPPPHDVCSTSVPTLGIGGAVTGNLEGAFDESSFPCIDRAGPSVYYQFFSGSSSSVTLTLRPEGFDGWLGLASGCGDQWGNTCTGKVNATTVVGGTEMLSLTGLVKNTTYYVVVGSEVGHTGTFSLSLSSP